MNYEEYYIQLKQIDTDYQAKLKPIDDDYETAYKPINEEHSAKRKLAEEEYNAKRQAIETKYKHLSRLKIKEKERSAELMSAGKKWDAKCKQLLDEHMGKREPIDSHYWELRQPIEDEYWSKRNKLDAEFKEHYRNLCPLCQSPLLVLSLAPFITGCTNRQCSNHIDPKEQD